MGAGGLVSGGITGMTHEAALRQSYDFSEMDWLRVTGEAVETAGSWGAAGALFGGMADWARLGNFGFTPRVSMLDPTAAVPVQAGEGAVAGNPIAPFEGTNWRVVPNRGFSELPASPGELPGSPASVLPGTRFQRVGTLDSPGAEFLAPEGTPFEQLGLPKDYRYYPKTIYETVYPWEARVGKIAPVPEFMTPGGGQQFDIYPRILNQLVYPGGPLRVVRVIQPPQF